MKDKKLGKKYRYLNVPYYEIVFNEYKYNGIELIKYLKEKHPDEKDNINIVEHYPFWSLMGYSAYIKYKDHTIAHIISHNRRCTPTKKVQPKIFKRNKIIIDKGKFVQLGAFDYVMLNNLIFGMRGRVNNDRDIQRYHNIMNSHLVEMRNYYLKKNSRTMFDDTLFQEFLVTCTGKTFEPSREIRLIRQKKYEQGKPPVFRYNPHKKFKEPESKYLFPNSSGNQINNPKNLRLVEIVKTKDETTDSTELDEDIDGDTDL